MRTSSDRNRIASTDISPMSSLTVRRVSREDIQLVQNLIERCLQLYMNQKEVVDTLLEQAKIEPGFTEQGNLHTSWIFLNLIG